jgi:hypothetical protein
MDNSGLCIDCCLFTGVSFTEISLIAPERGLDRQRLIAAARYAPINSLSLRPPPFFFLRRHQRCFSLQLSALSSPASAATTTTATATGVLSTPPPS